MVGFLAPGNYHSGPNRKARRVRKAQDRQTAKLARRPVVTQRHPQQERVHRKIETLRESLSDKQIDILAKGFQLLRTVCLGPNGSPLDPVSAKDYANQTIDLLDTFAAAEKDIL